MGVLGLVDARKSCGGKHGNTTVIRLRNPDGKIAEGETA
jgi:hypothetical protein